jgi:hypothetical protein
VAEGQEANLLHASTNSAPSSGIPSVSATAFTLNIVTAGGTVLLVSGLITAAIYRLPPRGLVRAFADVVGAAVVGWSVGLLLGRARLVFLQSTPVLGWMVVAP